MTGIGRAPTPQDRESFHLGRAKSAYVAGMIDVDRLEELVGHVLAGGWLTENLEPSTPRPAPPVDAGVTATRATALAGVAPYYLLPFVSGVPEPGGLPAPVKPAQPTHRLR